MNTNHCLEFLCYFVVLNDAFFAQQQHRATLPLHHQYVVGFQKVKHLEYLNNLYSVMLVILD